MEDQPIQLGLDIAYMRLVRSYSYIQPSSEIRLGNLGNSSAMFHDFQVEDRSMSKHMAGRNCQKAIGSDDFPTRKGQQKAISLAAAVQAWFGNPEMVNLLLQAGADPELRNCLGRRYMDALTLGFWGRCMLLKGTTQIFKVCDLYHRVQSSNRCGHIYIYHGMR